MPVRLIRQFVFVLLAAVLAVAPAFAADPKRNLAVAKTTAAATEQRVALVIGNSAYKPRRWPIPSTTPAPSPPSSRPSASRSSCARTSPRNRSARAARVPFQAQARRRSAVLLRRPRLQVKGVNYFPVVDADIASGEDVPTQSLDANKVLELMDEAKTRLNLVFLDACRNNPYARSFRSAADGLAKSTRPRAPSSRLPPARARSRPTPVPAATVSTPSTCWRPWTCRTQPLNRR